jgi:hypothetical protein
MHASPPLILRAMCVCCAYSLLQQDHPDSANQIAKFIETYGVNVDEVELPVRPNCAALPGGRSQMADCSMSALAA